MRKYRNGKKSRRLVGDTKYSEEYLAYSHARGSKSVKASIYDTDGNGDVDTIFKAWRHPAVRKSNNPTPFLYYPPLEAINAPTGISTVQSPSSAPTNLSVLASPQVAPTGVSSSIELTEGPTGISAVASPQVAPTGITLNLDRDEDGVYADADFDDNDPTVGTVVPPTSPPSNIGITTSPSVAPTNISTLLPPQVAPTNISTLLPPQVAPTGISVLLPPQVAPTNISLSLDQDEDGVYSDQDFDDTDDQLGQNITVSTMPDANTTVVSTWGEPHAIGLTIGISATPNSGYEFSHWEVGVGSGTFENVNSASTNFTSSSASSHNQIILNAISKVMVIQQSDITLNLPTNLPNGANIIGGMVSIIKYDESQSMSIHEATTTVSFNYNTPSITVSTPITITYNTAPGGATSRMDFEGWDTDLLGNDNNNGYNESQTFYGATYNNQSVNLNVTPIYSDPY